MSGFADGSAIHIPRHTGLPSAVSRRFSVRRSGLGSSLVNRTPSCDGIGAPCHSRACKQITRLRGRLVDASFHGVAGFGAQAASESRSPRGITNERPASGRRIGRVDESTAVARASGPGSCGRTHCMVGALARRGRTARAITSPARIVWPRSSVPARHSVCIPRSCSSVVSAGQPALSFGPLVKKLISTAHAPTPHFGATLGRSQRRTKALGVTDAASMRMNRTQPNPTDLARQ